MSDNRNNDLNYETITKIINEADKEEFKERRKKRDFVSYVPAILSFTAFILVVVVWFLLDYASPPKYYGWLSLFGYYGPEQSTSWMRRPVNISYILLLVSIGLCIIAYFCNRARKRRKRDVYRASIFISGAIAIITFIAYLITFIPMGIIGRW